MYKKNTKQLSNIFNLLTKELKKKTYQRSFPLTEPFFNIKDYNSVKKCLKTTHVSTHGKCTLDFEKKIAKYLGVKYVISTINGTSAIHTCLNALNVYRGDEVLLPSFNYIASANAISYLGAIPHFIEIDEESLNVSPSKLYYYLKKISKQDKKNFCINKKTGRIIKAMIITNIFGHSADYDSLKKIRKKFNIKIIEDASESVGSYYKNKHSGTNGDLGVLSFNGNKIITTGGGGAIVINNSIYKKKILELVTIAKKKHPYLFNYLGVGYNYRMPSLNAALGISQINNISKRVKFNRRLYNFYKNYFSKYKNIKIHKEPNNCKSNYWLQAVIINKSNKKIFNKILKVNNFDLKFTSRPAWTLCHKLKMFTSFPKMNLSLSEKMFFKVLCIPSSIKIK